MMSFVGSKSAASLAALPRRAMPAAAAGLKFFGTQVPVSSSQSSSASVKASPNAKTTMPKLSTEPIKGPSVWTGEDLKKDPWWGHMLTPEDVDDLLQATQVAKKSAEWLLPGVPDIVAKETFPLGLATMQKLDALRDTIENGKGLAMIRNMPVQDARFTEDDLAIMYLGVSAHIGHIILQSSSGLRSVSRGYGFSLGRG
mmetsp:Transcript_153080/g.266861  ORF Transcript_153080/g.266861 Transcript_153080/m.266861 type:complete len:199 (-) Transcript_153080:7-603(-)